MPVARILIVDDVQLERKRLEDLLTDNGYTVDTAHDGVAALQHLFDTDELPDLILSDVIMPKMNGFELCRMIKAEAPFSSIPIFLLTCLDEPTAVIEGLQCGATNFIHKPYDADFLLERIDSVLKTQKYRQGDNPDKNKVFYAGKEYQIDCDSNRVLDLLLSTYEHSYRQNRELMATRDKLSEVNKRLEDAVAKTMEDYYVSEKNRLFNEGLINSISASDYLILLTLDRTGQIIKANNAAKEFFALPADHLEGAFINEIEGLGSKFKEQINTCLLSGTEISEIDFPVETATRGTRWGVASLSNTHGPEVLRESVFIFIRDITERKIFEDELASSRGELMGTLDQLAAAITKVTQLKNYDVRIDLLHHHFYFCHEVNQCNNEQCPQFGSESYRCWEFDANGDVVCKEELSAHCQQDISTCDYYKTIMSEPLNHIQELFNCMMDILQAGHKNLQDAYDELSHTRVQSLQQEKMASIGQLSAGVAHEINNPVGFISSNLSTMRRYVQRFETFFQEASKIFETNGGNPVFDELMLSFEQNKIRKIMDDLPTLVAECIDGTDRVTGIVNDLKTFSRSDDDSLDYVDVNACIDSTLNIVRNEIKYNADLVKEYGQLPLLYANSHKLGQVFMNLVMNSAHAIEEKGEIKIRTRQDDDNNIVVIIEDNGCVMPAEIQSKIFEPFFTTKEVGKGTGLGMSVVYDILQKHNATIDLASEVGKGTMFTLTFPTETRQ
ncbi:MAG: hypothetical protein C0623_03845 [Desulfuromonas sp.]|nr:MAG: hypothetical protein C0623_03845 [Desulfuromonas sp.]